MTREKVTTINKTLYGKYSRDLKVNNIICIISAIVLAILACVIYVNRFVLVKVYIEGPSMQPTLYGGDIVACNIYAKPTYGNVIVIKDQKPGSKDWIIKRVIGLEGDTVKIEGGYVYLKKTGEDDFTRLDEPYIAKQGYTFYNNLTNENVWEIGKGQIFYLGDNRMNSADSRVFGMCDESQVVGVVSDFALRFKGVTGFINDASIAVNDFFAGNN